ncbi:MAG: DUF3375 domain-containing protein [Spirochaetaceae bacterium]|nr:MAG: DUF3375 domain-containing protein [Spirochaetaceae bacterium]
MSLDFQTLQSLRKNHPAWRLMTADSGPLVAAFLDFAFRKSNTRYLAQAELVSRLEDYLYALRQIEGEDAFPRTAENYLTDWAHNDRGWLRKFYPPNSDDAHFDLTPATEKALQWIDGLFERSFVGTQSRLFTALTLLREIAHGVEEDPAARISRLEEEQSRIAREIEDIRAGNIPTLDERSLREHFSNFSRTARELLSDFRAVEHNFRELDQNVREKIAGWSDEKSTLLHEVFGEQDVISESDEGRSFRAFWDFLMSPESQDELSELLDRVYELEALGELRHDKRLKRIHHDWMTAGEQTQRTVARLSQQLRRFLDEQAFFENKRIMQILDQIGQHGLVIRAGPPKGEFARIDGVRADIALPLERPLFSSDQEGVLNEGVDDDSPLEIDISALYNQVMVDRARLWGNITQELSRADQVSLDLVVERYPLQEGLAELVTYLALATESEYSVIDEQHRSLLLWTDSGGITRRARLPRVIFQRRGATDVVHE